VRGGTRARELRVLENPIIRALVPELEPADPRGEVQADARFMALALAEARAAGARDEVPIGAVVVCAGEVVARAGNRVRADVDPTAHAELLALRAAAARLGSVRLLECVVYSSVEPCFMCAGALVHARVRRAVFAVRDPKFGACVSLGNVLEHPRANHRLPWSEGVLADEARELLQEFFRARRGTDRGCEPGAGP
jgi:tRNA(adenine34) deaminase